MNTPTEVAIAWAAGIFEGEGTIILRRQWHSIYIRVSMTDEDIIEKLAAIWGTTARVWREDPGGTRKAVYRVSLSSDAAVQWLKLMSPFFGKRRTKRMEEAIAWHSLRLPRIECAKLARAAQLKSRIAAAISH